MISFSRLSVSFKGGFMDLKEWLSDIDSSLINEFIAHHSVYLEKDVSDLNRFISLHADPLRRFIGTTVKNYGTKAFHGSFFLLSFIKYYENQASNDRSWLELTLAFMDESYCFSEAYELLKDHNSYIDPSVQLVADCCPSMIYYFQPFFQRLGVDFKIGFFSTFELLRRSFENSTKIAKRFTKH
jgi:hypothetical protein